MDELYQSYREPAKSSGPHGCPTDGDRTAFRNAQTSARALVVRRRPPYSFDNAPAELVAYDDLEHVRLTRDFLNAPERYLRALRSEK